MNNYELMYIVDTSSEEVQEDIKKRIEGTITGREGIVDSFEKLGKKRLAYPIAKNQYGVYYLVNLKGDGKIVQALDYFLRLNTNVIRHIILVFSEKHLRLREQTILIQKEEAERMRRGGRPLSQDRVPPVKNAVQDSAKAVTDKKDDRATKESAKKAASSPDVETDTEKSDKADPTPEKVAVKPLAETIDAAEGPKPIEKPASETAIDEKTEEKEKKDKTAAEPADTAEDAKPIEKPASETAIDEKTEDKEKKDKTAAEPADTVEDAKPFEKPAGETANDEKTEDKEKKDKTAAEPVDSPNEESKPEPDEVDEQSKNSGANDG